MSNKSKNTILFLFFDFSLSHTFFSFSICASFPNLPLQTSYLPLLPFCFPFFLSSFCWFVSLHLVGGHLGHRRGPYGLLLLFFLIISFFSLLIYSNVPIVIFLLLAMLFFFFWPIPTRPRHMTLWRPRPARPWAQWHQGSCLFLGGVSSLLLCQGVANALWVFQSHSFLLAG